MNDISEKYDDEIYRLGFLLDEQKLREVEEHGDIFDKIYDISNLIGSYGTGINFHNRHVIK